MEVDNEEGGNGGRGRSGTVTALSYAGGTEEGKGKGKEREEGVREEGMLGAPLSAVTSIGSTGSREGLIDGTRRQVGDEERSSGESS